MTISRSSKSVDKIQIWDGTRIRELDNVDGAGISISLPHHKVHDGDYYITSDYDGDVDTGAPRYWQIAVPDSSTEAHFVFAVSSDTAGTIELFEDPTISGLTTQLTIFNSNRRSSNVCSCAVRGDPTVTDDGTRLQVDRVGSDNNKTKIGGELRQVTENVLGRNKNYLVKVTPDSDNAQVTFSTEFYETETS